MIPCVNIIELIESALDAEGFDRYDFFRDYKPAITYAQNWIVNALSPSLGKNKFPEENLSDIVYNRIFLTNKFSRVLLSGQGLGDVWGILNISINPVIYPDTTIIQPDLTKSVYSDIHSFVKAYKSATRITAQEINTNRLDPFSVGNEVTTCPELQEFGFKLYTNYKGGYDPTQTLNGVDDVAEIEITPTYPNKVLAIEYIKQPSEIINPTDSVEFPSVLTDMFVQKSLNFLAYKRDETPLAVATDKEIQYLIQLLS